MQFEREHESAFVEEVVDTSAEMSQEELELVQGGAESDRQALGQGIGNGVAAGLNGVAAPFASMSKGGK